MVDYVDAALAAIGRAMVPDLFPNEPERNRAAKAALSALWDGAYLCWLTLAIALWAMVILL